MSTKRENIVIVGSSGFAREIRFLIDRINEVEEKWKFLGYIDNSKGKEIIGDDTYIISSTSELNVVIAIGNPKIRQKIIEKYSSNSKIRFPNIIDPTAILSNSVVLGKGNIICANTILTTDVILGNFNIINLSCTVGHDTIIGDLVTINPGSNISGNVKINSYTEIGTGTKVIQGIEVGANSIVGAGTVIIRKLPGNCTAIGVPAKVIK